MLIGRYVFLAQCVYVKYGTLHKGLFRESYDYSRGYIRTHRTGQSF